ncbi:hypothetical protein [Eubacterium sp.]|nr:hypothetical protein [Eubacterium sp.]
MENFSVVLASLGSKAAAKSSTIDTSHRRLTKKALNSVNNAK